MVKLRVLASLGLVGLDFIGSSAIKAFDIVGDFSLFLLDMFKTLFGTKLKFSKFLFHMEKIGVNSFAISAITGCFAGAVLTIQSYKGFKQFGGEQFIGPVVSLAMARELGPVLTGFMVAGRAGSAIAAEIATMQITEQIDALKTLCINVQQYLIVPRILAGAVILPFLALFSMMFGVAGGYLVSVYTLGINPEEYTSGIKSLVEFSDIIGGLIKASVFGFILTAVGSYKGYTAKDGARGVGIATTQSVVVSSILIIIANYFLAVILFGPS
ncbi:MAG: ABC transporter permease [Candidatus Babeliales bacterium]|nr:ABC transporter permease [Candidatus Babeliales bacterium]